MMNASIIIDDIIRLMQRRYGKATPFGRSRLFKFSGSLTCSINYSKLLAGHKYFFGLAQEVLDPKFAYPETDLGEFVLLICGSAERVLILPRALILDMMQNVPTRRLDVLYQDGVYILQTTKHPKIDVTEFLNAFPRPTRSDSDVVVDARQEETADRAHIKLQWSLIQLGRAEGCSVWVPPSDRNLAYQGQSFQSRTLDRLPNFGFDENTRRIVQNIDVLWLTRNVIRKAFEIESTTTIYSGLLRLNDLVLAQPNNQIELYIVAPDARRERVYSQLLRPSFQSLVSRCRFVTFETVEEQLKWLEAMPVDAGARITGLIRGEQVKIPEGYVYSGGL